MGSRHFGEPVSFQSIGQRTEWIHQRNEAGMEALLTVLRMTDSRGTTQSRVTLSLRRSSPSTPPAAAAASTREDGWATGRAETVTLDSHAIRTMTSGKSPLDRHPGPSLLLPFLSLLPWMPVFFDLGNGFGFRFLAECMSPSSPAFFVMLILRARTE